MVCPEGHDVVIGVKKKKKSTAMRSVDYSAEICPRKKTLDSWNGKNYSKIKS